MELFKYLFSYVLGIIKSGTLKIFIESFLLISIYSKLLIVSFFYFLLKTSSGNDGNMVLF